MGKSEGDELLARAEKKGTSNVGWFGSQNSKWEEAGDLFQKAANAFKVEKRWADAGKAFEREAGCRQSGNEINDAINAFKNAANAFKKVYPEAAVSALHNAIQLLVKEGNFRQAADREKEVAQIYSTDRLDLAKSRDSYVRAGEWYKQEDANATANQCYQLAAELSGELGDYQRSMELYQTVGEWSLTSALTKYSVKEYWLRAAICSMAMGDLVTTNNLLQDFARKDVTFPSTREAKFAHSLMVACEEGDVDQYTGAIFEYDKVTKLDNWKTEVLLKIKKALEEDEGALT